VLDYGTNVGTSPPAQSLEKAPAHRAVGRRCASEAVALQWLMYKSVTILFPPASGGTREPQARRGRNRALPLAVLQESLGGEAGDPELASGEELVFAREGVQNGLLRKLRRGQYRVQAEIDLHGLTVPEAKEELRSFLAHALEHHFRCVRIIHGKGLRSGHRGPVLKGAVSSVLRRVGPVLAYVSARQVDGGTGALYVLLATWRSSLKR
jgi:DNA-nicking Smr family endonuclease